MGRVELMPMNVEFSIEDDGGEFLLKEAQEDLVIVVLTRDEAGGDHVGLIDLGAISVILNDRQDGREIAVGNEDDSHPMMDKTAGNRNIFAVKRGLKRSNEDLFGCKLAIC